MASSPRSLDNEALVGDLHDLRAFAFAADLQSVAGAAKLMGESKATVSRRIARLEAALGVPLLHRTTRGVAPTEDGSTYRTRVAEVLELLGDANATIRQTRALPSGNLRMTVASGFEDMIAPALARFTVAFPDIVLSVVVTERFVDLEAEHIDVALRVTGRLADSPLIAHRLVDLELVVVAAPDYLAQRKPPKQIGDLTSHRLVLLGPRSTNATTFERLDGGAPVVVQMPHSTTATNVGFAKALTLASSGVAVLPRLVVERDLEEGRLVHVLRSYVVRGANLYLLHRGGHLVPSKVRAFRDFIVRDFAAKCAGRCAPKGPKDEKR